MGHETKIGFIINDLHFPYEDKARYKVALKIAKKIKPDHIYLNGDVGEFLAVSTHSIHPAEKIPFCAEVAYCNKRFDELQQMFPETPVTLICGNHSYRFFRYIRDVAPEMWGLIDCPKLFNFQERPGWKFVDYGPNQLVQCLNSNLYLRHEPLGLGKTSAKVTAENSYVDLATGHTHTFQAHTHKKFGPRPMTTTAYTLGWLGDKSRHVFDYRGAKDSWVTGCTVVEVDVATRQYTLDFICLDKLPALYRGQKFNAK